MNEINGKILVFTDLHLGLKNNSVKRLNICVKVIKHIVSYIKDNSIENVIFCGDWHHHRISIDNNVLNVSYKLMQVLAKYAKVYMIVGNHDSFMKNSIDINSLVCFKSIPNVNIVDQPIQVSINGNSSLLVPWLGDISKFQSEQFDMMFGHFEASSKFLIKSYVEDHSANNSATNAISICLENDSMLNSTKTENIGDYIGNFVDVVKRNSGTIFSGHIHQHRECISKGRKFIFVGDPYQQNLGEKEYSCGFYTIDSDNSYEFHEIDGIPRHIEMKMSDIVKDIDSYDFSNVKGNILHKIYDVDVDAITNAKISQKINDLIPYEELLPDYEVDINNSEIQIQNDSIELIKKSKLDYIKSYIDNIDKNVLNEQNIDSNKLFETLKEYYNKVVEEK